MHHLVTLGLAVRADKTPHSRRVVIVQLKLYPRLPRSTVHEGLAVCHIRPHFLFVAGADASSLSLLHCVFGSVLCPRLAVGDFPFSFPFTFLFTHDQRVQLVCEEFQFIKKQYELKLM